MVAYIERLAVRDKDWISGEDFQQGVALCQALPGATAMQCAAYVGLKARGPSGAVAAYAGFGLPAFVLMLVLSAAYRTTAGTGVFVSAMTGLRVLVVALAANATLSFGRSSLKRLRDGVFAILAAGAFLLKANPFLIVLLAGAAGAVLLKDPARVSGNEAASRVGWKPFRNPAACLAFAAVFIGCLILFNQRLAALGFVMMKVDLFAFGGGFASVPLLFHEIVDVRGWLSSGVFMDGIALGQVTPGPIVITATFVGFQIAGFMGAVVGTISIFLPSIFIVVLAEPWFRRFQSSAVFRGASRALILSFVGLLASVTIQFARSVPWGIPSILIGTFAFAALVRKINVLWVVLAAGLVSLLCF